MRFEDLALSRQVLKGIQEMGFEEASPIQAKSIEPLMNGKDIIGQAQTGTGKTAAFGIPILELVTKQDKVQALVLCPTRELCIQVAQEIAALGKHKTGIRVLPVYGGASIEKQIKNINKGSQIIVGTPGRVMDLMRRNALKLNMLRIAVLDEADEMFAMGFRDDMKTILEQSNEDRITCFYSATMGKDIMQFSEMYQKNPEIIRIEYKEVTVENISQYYLEMARNMKGEILSRLIDIHAPRLAIVFCNTKRMVDELVNEFSTRGYSIDGLHGDLKQSQRDTVMRKFRNNTIDILVATDVAARGIDVGEVDIVFNYDLPQDEEYYVHRIGRTARAGRTGKAFTFVVGRDIYKLEDIKRFTKANIKRIELPTIDEMDSQNQLRIVADIEKVLADEQELREEKVIVDQLLEQGYGSVEIASALIRLVTDMNVSKKHSKLDHVDYGEKYRIEKNVKSGKGKRKSNSKKPSSRIFINKGERDRLTAATILQAFHEHTSVPKSAIGDIVIKRNFTFVEVPETYMEKALKGLHNKKIKGNRIEVERSTISKKNK